MLLEPENTIRASAIIYGEMKFTSIQADFFDYDHHLIMSKQLFDDGQHGDERAGDNIFCSMWQGAPQNEVLYMNLKLTDNQANEWLFEYADYNITLSDSISLNSLEVVDDHINNDHKINPGEHIRLKVNLKNDYSFELNKVKVSLEVTDSYVQIDPKVIIFDSISPFTNASISYDLKNDDTYLGLSLSPEVPDTHKINLTVSLSDNRFHYWKKKCQLQVEPLKYVPNQIRPTKVAGWSNAYFVIKDRKSVV